MLNIPVYCNLRVRHLKADVAAIELDEDVLNDSKDFLPDIATEISRLGFKNVNFRKYKTGNVAKF